MCLLILIFVKSTNTNSHLLSPLSGQLGISHACFMVGTLFMETHLSHYSEEMSTLSFGG